jgi:hypothetical protein
MMARSSTAGFGFVCQHPNTLSVRRIAFRAAAERSVEFAVSDVIRFAVTMARRLRMSLPGE